MAEGGVPIHSDAERNTGLNVFTRPLCLISSDKTNGLQANEYVLGQIGSIELPCVVIAIVGLYRSGKSFLMNILAQEEKGFALGETIESKTKGIWVWCKMHPRKENTVLVLLDTEGLGDVQKGDENHDMSILTLATLMCSTLVYNKKGVMDMDAINELTVSEIVKRIHVNLDQTTNGDCILPSLVHVLRDFTLKLKKRGVKGVITSDEYLEIALRTSRDRSDDYNKPREAIRKYFPDRKRKCFTLPFPGDDEVLQNLDSLTYSDLEPRFKQEAERFVTFMYSLEPKQLLFGKPVNGQIFVKLIVSYLKAIAKGAVPNLDDAITVVAKLENEKIKHQAMDIFMTTISKDKIPFSIAGLKNNFLTAKSAAFEHLSKHKVPVAFNAIEIETERRIRVMWNEIAEQNAREIHRLGQTVMANLIKEKLQLHRFNFAGGYKKYRAILEELRNEYYINMMQYDEDQELPIWDLYSDELSELEKCVINMDEEKSLRQQNREKNARRAEEQQVANTMGNTTRACLASQRQAFDMTLQHEALRRQREEESFNRQVENVRQRIERLQCRCRSCWRRNYPRY